MSDPSFGDRLYRIVGYSKTLLFEQGEMAQLTFLALNRAATEIQGSPDQTIEIGVPIGYPNRQPMLSKCKFAKDELVRKYGFLANTQLSINGIYQLVTIVEAMLNDLLFEVIKKYPKKIGNKKMISAQSVLMASSTDELLTNTVYSLLNDLSYKTPKDYAEGFAQYTKINILECPSYHKYIEVKATRDVLIHNRGISNEIYEAKAGTHARVKKGFVIPVDTGYFMESYEACLQFNEWLENELNEIWPSAESEARRAKIAQHTAAPDP